VPHDLMEQIFHPFVTTKEGHAGLGLATDALVRALERKALRWRNTP